MQPIRAIVHDGRIEPLGDLDIPEGTEVLVMPLTEDAGFWLEASQAALGVVWDNSEDDIYGELL